MLRIVLALSLFLLAASSQAANTPALEPDFKLDDQNGADWFMLKPLPKGKHVLTLGGRYNSSSPAFGHMVQDIHYEIEVK